MDRKTFLTFEKAAKDVELLKLVVESLSTALSTAETRITDLEFRVNKAENRKTLSIQK
jgi:hypothetical protein